MGKKGIMPITTMKEGDGAHGVRANIMISDIDYFNTTQLRMKFPLEEVAQGCHQATQQQRRHR